MTTPFVITSEERAYIASSLNAVSRSFALVIPMLEEPLDTCVGIAYLLCRVCDNIEDCKQPFSWKQERFREFRELLAEPQAAHKVLRSWSNADWMGLREDERLMMSEQGGLMLWELFARMPQEYASIIARWADEMAEGMERLLAPAPNDLVEVRRGIHILRDLPAFDLYCYYVAGTVGRMCTELIVQFYTLDEATIDILNHHCEAFGRALQKTNIFKDFAEDLSRGVCYFPLSWMEQVNEVPLAHEGSSDDWTREVIEHIWGEVDQAVDYILALPYHAKGYRQFCLRAVLPAYETLLLSTDLMDSLFTSRHAVKISRAQMMECLQWAAEMDTNNTRLLEHRRARSLVRDAQLRVSPVLGYPGLHTAATDHSPYSA